MSPSRLPILQTFLIGLGLFGVSVIWGIYNAFVPLFLEQKFGLEPSMIGFFMTLDNIASLLIQPPVGALSDRIRTPIGRRMPFILVGAPLGAFAFGIIPIAAVLPLFVACTSTLLLSMAMWRTPVAALMPDVIPSQFRSQANGIINFMMGIGAIAAYFGGATLYDLNPNYPFWMGSALVLGASLLLFAFVREPKIATEETKDVAPSMLESLQILFKEQEKSALFLLLTLFCLMLGYSAIEVYWTLYATNHLKVTASDATKLLGQMSLVFVLAALPIGYLASSWGRKRTIGIGLSLMTFLLLGIFFTPPTTLTIPIFSLPILGVVPVVGVVLMFLGVAWAMIIIHALPMLVDMTDQNKLGTYTGLYYLFSTFAAIVGPNLNGIIVQLSGNNYNFVMISAAFWMIVAILLLIRVKRGEVKTHETAMVETLPNSS
jgi:maltose/moltooligosaccharide transporter